ncbi:hypothetical protein, partial [Sulfitobacter sp. HI0076]|uniref:hypothetical protein n=1 Tax=Sulfitobacter sp. HI0076 TaxID=1822251 RepID=UPI001F32C8BC
HDYAVSYRGVGERIFFRGAHIFSRREKTFSIENLIISLRYLCGPAVRFVGDLGVLIVTEN